MEDLIKENSNTIDIETLNGSLEEIGENLTFEKAVELTTTLGVEKVKQEPQTLQIPLIINLKEKIFDNEDIQIDSKMDLVCLVDVSSSMSGPRMKYVHQTLLSLLEVLNKGHRLALVIFDHEAEFLMNFKKITEKNKPKIKDIILSIRKRGKTNIKAGLELAQNVLGRRFSANPTSCIFLLSDGDHNCGEFCIDEVFNGDFSRTKSDYILSCFGYGDDHDAYLLEKLAMRKYGNYYYINNLKQIQECFLDSLGLYTSVLAKDVKVKVKLLENEVFKNIFFTKHFGSNWEEESCTELDIHLPSFYAGFDRHFVSLVGIDFENIEEELEIKIAEITIKMKTLDKENPKKFKISKTVKLKILPTSKENFENPIFPIQESGIPILAKNVEAMTQLVRVKSAEIMSQVDRFFSNKNFIKAIITLEEFLSLISQIEEIQDSPLVIQVKETLIEQKDFIIKDEKGENHRFKTSMFIVQMMHVFDSESSSSINKSDMFLNKKQIKMRSMAIY